MTRGLYNFEIKPNGFIVDSIDNLEKLRSLFRDAQIIARNWGPGIPGDFDHGSWHILCHLAGASGVFKTTSGIVWCGITHRAENDSYDATATYRNNGALKTLSLKSEAGASLVAQAECVGFIEGSSLGHVAARGVMDSGAAYNGWKRQDFDQSISSEKRGGTVWEQWVTTRDIRTSSEMGTSVLKAYLTLVSFLGGRFVAAVARGRREHQHPRHLVALVKSGFVARDEATWNVTPDPVPLDIQNLLYEARPEQCLSASEKLPFVSGRQRYFMFSRRISAWSAATDVTNDLTVF